MQQVWDWILQQRVLMYNFHLKPCACSHYYRVTIRNALFSTCTQPYFEDNLKYSRRCASWKYFLRLLEKMNMKQKGEGNFMLCYMWQIKRKNHFKSYLHIQIALVACNMGMNQKVVYYKIRRPKLLICRFSSADKVQMYFLQTAHWPNSANSNESTLCKTEVSSLFCCHIYPVYCMCLD